ncbi:hypothetical protein LTR47_011615 [Exophiala xenobiotica]|nr:hypothetical protein LTR47_011615 [Exophiala xenobiotica]KAK5244283.1 hypothetical protein LTS06_010122 [Exophiala xenobiotica]KAK5317382.1 hypothetical protein LTR93_008593 [Exophiala xenobiotica]KAK5361370.1 hypothetical protein LTS03_010323 [Exophiala xenobiotica]KAK5378673.1 hypothetical protein LTR11_004368 [Exophiala xenobiotica]
MDDPKKQEEAKQSVLQTAKKWGGYKIDSAGTTAALSGAYIVLAGRRRVGLMNKFGTRGILRGATMGLCLANLVGGGLAYGFGSRAKEDDKKTL